MWFRTWGLVGAKSLGHWSLMPSKCSYIGATLLTVKLMDECTRTMTEEVRMETVRKTQFFLLRVTVETPVIGLLWWSPQTEPSTTASTAGSGRLQTVSKALSDPDSEDTVNLHSCRSYSVSCVETRIVTSFFVKQSPTMRSLLPPNDKRVKLLQYGCAAEISQTWAWSWCHISLNLT